MNDDQNPRPEDSAADQPDVEHTLPLQADESAHHPGESQSGTPADPERFAPPGDGNTDAGPAQPVDSGSQAPGSRPQPASYPSQQQSYPQGHALPGPAQPGQAQAQPGQAQPGQTQAQPGQPQPPQHAGQSQTPGPWQGGAYGSPQQSQHYPAYAGMPAGTPAKKQSKAKVSRGIWPAVAALSLLVGLVGGGLGGYAMNEWDDAHQEPGRTSGGLADVDTVSTAPLPADNGSIAAVAQKLLPSTVQIIADYKGEEGGATGSGFFLDKQGHVVTNNHVVADAAEGGKITVVDHEGKRHDATVVGRSPVYDLAVLYVKGLSDIKPAALGSSKKLRVGENVVAIGSPLGLSSTVTSGIISAVDRPVTTGGNEDSQSYINAVQTDAAINPGNSGGPLVNLAGQVVGVNSAIATTGGSSMGGESGNIGVGFAIPIEQVRVTADQILKDGEARYPVIGATVSSDGSGEGAVIQEVLSDSPAKAGGLEKGDVVTRLDDRVVTDSPTLIVAIRSHLPGDTVTMTVNRGGNEKQIKVELDSKVG